MNSSRRSLRVGYLYKVAKMFPVNSEGGVSRVVSGVKISRLKLEMNGKIE